MTTVKWPTCFFRKKHTRVSIAEWGEPNTNYSQENPIIAKYLSGATVACTVDLYHLLKKLNVTK